jgi:hypothetical protein
MPTQTFNIETRIKALNAVLAEKDDQELLKQALTDANGDFSLAIKDLKGKLPDVALTKLEFAHSLADFSADNVHLVKALADDAKVSTLRDVALHFNVDGIA